MRCLPSSCWEGTRRFHAAHLHLGSWGGRWGECTGAVLDFWAPLTEHHKWRHEQQQGALQAWSHKSQMRAHGAALPQQTQGTFSCLFQLLVPQVSLGLWPVTPPSSPSSRGRLLMSVSHISPSFLCKDPCHWIRGPPNPGSSHLRPYLDDICRDPTSP